VTVGDSVARPLIQERLNTYVELRRLGLVNEGRELIEWSERDGWAHFYLYDGNGKLENRITSGPFHCEDIIGIDEKKRILYFTANGREGGSGRGEANGRERGDDREGASGRERGDGREGGEDPYYLHLYKVNLDGSGLAMLDPGDFDHIGNMDDNNEFFVDNY